MICISSLSFKVRGPEGPAGQKGGSGMGGKAGTKLPTPCAAVVKESAVRCISVLRRLCAYAMVWVGGERKSSIAVILRS